MEQVLAELKELNANIERIMGHLQPHGLLNHSYALSYQREHNVHLDFELEGMVHPLQTLLLCPYCRHEVLLPRTAQRLGLSDLACTFLALLSPPEFIYTLFYGKENR